MANENFDVPAIGREIGKKKRSNRSARLKQCKLNARREQWLSQVKKENKERTTIPVSPTSPLQRTSQSKSTTKKERAYSNTPSLNCEELTNLQNSDLDSPTHNNSKNNEPTTNNSSSITSSCTGSSIGSYSRSVSDAEEEEEEEEEEAEEEDYEGEELDDWETIADALSTSPNSSSHHVHSPMSTDSFKDTKANSRTWRPNDEFRPQSLPNIMNHRTFNAPPQSSCPICYEDLDLTDSSFLPCDCGFHVCLFCHKRILEADARCPGCRKQYKTVSDGEEIGVVTGLGGPPLVYRFTRSCSLKNRY